MYIVDRLFKDNICSNGQTIQKEGLSFTKEVPDKRKKEMTAVHVQKITRRLIYTSEHSCTYCNTCTLQVLEVIHFFVKKKVLFQSGILYIWVVHK